MGISCTLATSPFMTLNDSAKAKTSMAVKYNETWLCLLSVLLYNTLWVIITVVKVFHWRVCSPSVSGDDCPVFRSNLPEVTKTKNSKAYMYMPYIWEWVWVSWKTSGIRFKFTSLPFPTVVAPNPNQDKNNKNSRTNSKDYFCKGKHTE